MSRQEIIAAIKQDLQTLPSDRAVHFKPTQALLRCPWHNGGQGSPDKLKINLDPANTVPAGYFYCWACKEHGHWSTFAELYGLRQFSRAVIEESARNDLHVQRFDLESVTPPDPGQFAAWPGIDWRTIPAKTLARYNARSLTFGRQPFLYLPVTVYEEDRGGIQCRLVRDRNNRSEKAYINTSGEWTKNTVVGFDVARRLPAQPLWVVEGPRDTAWIRACGCRSVGLIGSAVSEGKLELIRELDPPSVIVATDNDEAGNPAANKLLGGLRDHFPVERYRFKPGEDPCDLAPARIRLASQAMMARYGS